MRPCAAKTMSPLRHRLLATPALASAVAVLVCSITSLPARAVPAECTGGERVVFACEAGSKRLAVCASPVLTRDAGTLQYRFGRRQTADLVYPPTGSDWRAVTRGGVLMFSGGGGAFLAFKNRDYRYVVYSAVGRGWGDKAGVVVERAGRRVAHVGCTSAVTSEIGPDLFSAAGIASSDDGFDLP
jgi:hypothetical protein